MSIEMHPAHLAAEVAVREFIRIIGRHSYLATSKFARTCITVEIDRQTLYELRDNKYYWVQHRKGEFDTTNIKINDIRFYMVDNLPVSWRVISPLDTVN